MPTREPAAAGAAPRPQGDVPDPPVNRAWKGPFVRFIQAVETEGRETYFALDTPVRIPVGGGGFEAGLLHVRRTEGALLSALEQAFNQRWHVKVWVSTPYRTLPGSRRSVTPRLVIRTLPPP